MADNNESKELNEINSKMATIHDVSLLANVSNATVSRVFSGNAKVKKETKDLVLNAARKLGYNPEKLSNLMNEVERSTNTAGTNTIGMVVSQLSASGFGQFYLAAQQHAIREGKQLMIFNGEGVRSREKSYMKLLSDRGCEVIFLIETELSSVDVDSLMSSGQTIVRLDSRHNGLDNSLGYDHAGACHSACQLLILNNHKRFALFPGKGKLASARIKGFKQALSDYGLGFDPNLLIEHTLDGSSGVMELCRVSNDFSAIISATDKMAAEAMATLRQFGYEVPEEISIISLEGSDLAEYTYPRLTTVETPVSQIAEELIDISVELLKGNDWEILKDKRLTGRLIQRESVRPHQEKSMYTTRIISSPK